MLDAGEGRRIEVDDAGGEAERWPWLGVLRLHVTDVPAERVKLLQEAFKKLTEDPELLAEAKRAGRGISYTSPEEMRDLYDATLNASDEVMELVAQ